jgi:hypothetical protein
MNRRVWMSFVDSLNIEDQRDLDHLSSVVWGANRHARKGDVILIYRTAPFSDIKHLFVAGSNGRATRKEDLSDTEYVVELENKISLPDPIQLAEIRKDKILRNWSFAKQQQGMLRRNQDITDEGYWNRLLHLIVKKNIVSLDYFRKLGFSQNFSSSQKNGRSTANRFKVLISYASENYVQVRSLYRKLKKDTDTDLWFDKENLLPSHVWRVKIEESIMEADAVIICISGVSIRKKGVLKQEIAWSLNIADTRPGGNFSIVPVKLEDCAITNPRLTRWQFAELFKKGGYEKLLIGLRETARRSGKKI